MRSFVKVKPSRNGKITLSFIDIVESCLSREFATSHICLLIRFAKIKFSRKFPKLQYNLVVHARIQKVKSRGAKIDFFFFRHHI